MRKNHDIIFYIGWTLFIFSVLMRLTSWYSLADEDLLEKVFIKCLRYFSYFLCLSIFFETKMPSKHLIVYVAIEILLIIVSICSGDKTMLLLSWICIGAYKVDSRKCIKIWLLVQFSFLIVIIFASQVGIVRDYMFTPDLRPRHSLGFEWASIAPTIMLHCLLAYIYLKREKTNIAILAMFGAASASLYRLTDSRIPFFISMTIILFFSYEKYNRKRWQISRKVNKLFVSLPILCFMVSMIIGLTYNRDNVIWKSLNALLSDRLWLQHNALDYWGIPLFGKEIELIGYSIKTISNGAASSSTYNYVDCSYIQITLYYGVFFSFLILGIYVSIIRSYIKRNDYYVVWIITFILLVSLTEPRLINFAYNPFPILFCTKERIMVEELKGIPRGKDRVGKNIT